VTGRLRRFARSGTTGVLVVLTAISFLVAGLGFWLHRNTLDTDVWVDRVGPLAADPEVDSALTGYTTAQIMSLLNVEEFFTDVLPERGQILAGPLTGAVEDFVRDHVSDFFESDDFDDLWVALNQRAHAAAVDLLRGEEGEAIQADQDSVTIDFVPVINEVLRRIGERSPEILGRDVHLPTLSVDDVPSEARERLGDALGVDLDEDFATVTVFDAGKLKTTQDAVALFDDAVVIAALMTVVLAGLTLLVARDRRRSGLYLLAGVAIDLVLVRRVGFRVQEDVTGLVRNPANEGAARAVTDAFVDPLVHNALIYLWIAVGLGVVLFLVGPSQPAAAARDLGARAGRAGVAAVRTGAHDERTTVWVSDHVEGLQIGGVIAAAALLFLLELSWLGLLVLLVLLGAWEVVVSRMASGSAG